MKSRDVVPSCAGAGEVDDHRHATAHSSVVPVRVVDEDLMATEDYGDEPRRDRRECGGALEDEDRSTEGNWPRS